MGAVVIDMKMFWRVQPIKEGQATNEVFFKWLGFNIFGKRFNRYEELYKKHLFRSFTKKPNMFAYETYEEFAGRMGETEEEMRENIATMTEWLKGLKDYERPRFYTFPNGTRLSAKYVVQAMIGYDNRKVINIMSNKPFKSFSIW